MGNRQCPHMKSCAMYSVFTLAGTLRVWQDNYCTDAFERCERYAKAQRGEVVPKQLMPNGKMLQLVK